MRTERQGIIVWFQHMKNLRQLKRHGHIIYASKKLKYTVLYVNQDQVEEIEAKLLKLSFVLKTDRSQKPFLRTDFENAKIDEAKEYDYKMGI